MERFKWMAEAARGNILAHYDAAVSSVIDSIARFQHRADHWHGAVVAHVWEFLALMAKAATLYLDDRHLASVLMALDQGDWVGSWS